VTRKVLLNGVRLIVFVALLISFLQPMTVAHAALGWVGNQNPAVGSTTYKTVGNSLTVSVEVYKAGVTPGAGQGANITCTLNYATVPYFSGAWYNIQAYSMSYSGEAGNNDVYTITLNNLPVGLYEFKASCKDWTDNSEMWAAGAGNAKLVVDTSGGSCNTATQADNNVYFDGLGHNSFDSFYRSPFGAVKTDQGNITLRFRTCMDDLNQPPKIRVYNDRTNALAENYTTLEFDSHGSDASLGGVTYWKKTLSIPTQTTLLYYIFQALDGSAIVYYRDDNPSFYGGGWGSTETNQTTAENNSYQITVYDASFSTPSWLRNAVIYQVFPERFRNGDTTNDPTTTDTVYSQTVRKLSWDQPICNPRDSGAGCLNEYSNQFYGGDLQGLIDSLDYLQTQGITVIYLNPIFKSPSNHLYDTTDYKTIDPYFGDLTTFTTLKNEAAARGIQLILDGVFNHTSSDSVFFDRYAKWDSSGAATTPGSNDQSGACESTTSPYRPWYTISANPTSPGNDPLDRCNNTNNSTYTPGTGTWTDQYTSWWGYGTLPKLNSNLTAVRNYFYASGSNAIGPYWIGQGAKGWRFDVGDDVDQGTASGDSNGYWNGFRTQIQAVDSDSAMLGELWGDASSWLVGDQWDAVMNYRFRSAVLSWMFDSCSGNGCSGSKFQDNDSNDGSSSGPIEAISIDQFDNRLKSIQEDYPQPAWYAMMNLMGSHDTNRILFLLKKISGDNPTTALNKFKLLGIFQFTYPGAPTIYYGDEAGLAPDGYWANNKWEDDPYNRAAFPWQDQGLSPNESLQEHFRKLAVLRSQYDVLRTGMLTDSTRHNTNRTYAYARTNASDLAVVLLNRHTSNTQAVTMNGLDASYNGTILYDVLNCSGTPVTCPSYTVSSGSVTVNNIPPLWGAILVKGPLPTYQIELATNDDDLANNATTTLTATVYTLGGQLAASGTPVTFTLVSGAGNLSTNSATTDNNGQASVTFTAPTNGKGVSQILVKAGGSNPYPGAYDTLAIFYGYGTDISAQNSAVMTIGPYTLDDHTNTGVWAQKLGNGEPQLALARFTGNPAAGVDPYQGNVTSPYVDINLSSATNVTQLNVRVYCTSACAANDILWWWNATDGKWVPVTGSVVNTTDNYVAATITSSTSPTLAQLNGTPFVAGYESPTAIELVNLSADTHTKPWGLLALVGLGILILLSGLVLARRSR